MLGLFFFLHVSPFLITPVWMPMMRAFQLTVDLVVKTRQVSPSVTHPPYASSTHLHNLLPHMISRFHFPRCHCLDLACFTVLPEDIESVGWSNIHKAVCYKPAKPGQLKIQKYYCSTFQQVIRTCLPFYRGHKIVLS